MRNNLQSRPVFIFFLSPKVEQWFREKREQRQATIDVVDIESEGEEVEEERKDISDDEEKEQVKEQMMKPREAKESESEKKMNRNIGMKKSDSELEALRAQIVRLTKDLSTSKDKERDESRWRSKHESVRKVLDEKEIEVKNLKAMNEALSKRNGKEKEANVWKPKYEAAMKTIEERDETIDNLETMNETLDKGQTEIITALKLKLAEKAKETTYHENCAKVLKQEKERAKANLEKTTQKLMETEEKFKVLSSEKVPAMMAKFREKLEVKEEEVAKLKAEVDLQAEVEKNLAKRVEQSDLTNKDLEQKLLGLRKVLLEKDGLIAKAKKSQESESKLARLRFQILDLKDEMVLQKKDQELIIADTGKLIKEVVNLKAEIKSKDRLLESKTTESAEFKDIQMNMMNALKGQKKVIMKAENQEKIIENQKVMLTQLKQQSQVHLAQISRLTEVQRKSMNNTSTHEASLLKRELKRRTDQLTQMRSELLKVQSSKDSRVSMTKAGPHLAMAGIQTIGIEEAVKEYERIVNKVKDAEPDSSVVEVVNLEEEVVCQPDIYPYDDEPTEDTNTVISDAENVLKTSAKVLNTESNVKQGTEASLKNETESQTVFQGDDSRGSADKGLVENRRCSLCERVFLDENYLKQHLTKAHIVDLYKRPLSPKIGGVVQQTSQNQVGNSKRSRTEEDLEQTESIGVDQGGGPVKKIRLVGKSESLLETSQDVVLSILDSLIFDL